MNMFLAFAIPLALITSLAGGQSSSGKIGGPTQVVEDSYIRDARDQCARQLALLKTDLVTKATGGDRESQKQLALEQEACVKSFIRKETGDTKVVRTPPAPMANK